MSAARVPVRLGIAAVVVVAVLGAAGLRLSAEGRSALRASDDAWNKGDAMTAAVHARNAARAYVPGAEHTARAYLRLRDIADTSERKGDGDAALFAWRAMLSASIGSRPFSAPCQEACAGAEAAVARLAAAQMRASTHAPPGNGRGPARETVPAVADIVPSVGWGALLVIGAALWLGAGVRISRSLQSGGRLRTAELPVAAGMALAGLVVWIAGLLLG